jgi:HEPN domain-containing protein
MPPERFQPDDPREWLNRARSNLIQARFRQPDVYLEDLCFQAQQAAENALKAILLHRELAFPSTHDLSHLIGIFAGHGLHVPDVILDAADLSQYAVVTRYPDVVEDVT